MEGSGVLSAGSLQPKYIMASPPTWLYSIFRSYAFPAVIGISHDRVFGPWVPQLSIFSSPSMKRREPSSLVTVKRYLRVSGDVNRPVQRIE